MARKEHKNFLAFNVPPEVEQNYIFEVWKVFAQSASITRRKLAPLKIASRHYAAMAVIAASDHSATQTTLIKRMGLSPNVVLGMVDDLDQLGYARRVQNPRNRRENIVFLSKRGRDAYAKALVLLRQAEQELLSALTEQERNRLLEITQKLGTSLPSVRDLGAL
jgi:DNA-binding MarR family transcriptional regulator